jgi:hypothetical protein
MFGLFDSETLVKRINLDTEFEWRGIKYPANWVRLASIEERAAIGLKELEPEPYFDQRFYWSPTVPKLLDDRLEVKEDGTPLYVQVYDKATESMVDTTEQVVTKGLKSQWTAQVKNTAGSLLAGTDWMVIRKSERNVEIPASVVAKRAAIVTECDRLEAAIKACNDVPALIDVVSNQNWGA